MSRADDTRNQPRAVIHKRILDVAESKPDASLEAIAAEVGGANADFVERVLDEYGDPAGASTDGTTDHTMTQNGQTASDASNPTGRTGPDLDDLSAKQRETLRLVHERPERSQVDIADRLDVTRATVSRRLNDIPGFDWQDRRAFVRNVFDEEPGTESGELAGDDGEAETDETDADGAGTEDGSGTSTAAISDGEGNGIRPDAPERFDELDGRLDELETTLDELETTLDEVRTDGSSVDFPPELAHKVVHACMESDRISEEEELQLLKSLMAE